MATRAQIRRNVQNAKHSTGPRTIEGKRRASMNALKHGITAQVVLLPGEKAVEFNKRVHTFFARYFPQDAYEVILTQDAAYCSWQIDRCQRAGAARAYKNAVMGETDEERTEQSSAIELSQILFRAPFGRPTACPRGAMPDGEAGKTWPGDFEPDEHPSLVIIRLEANPFGASWLLNEWNTLEAPLQRGEGWNASERFRALRLLGIHAINACLDSTLTSFLRACEVLDPEAGSLVGEVWNELVSASDLPLLENQYRQSIERRPAMDQDAAREHLIASVRRQITRLEAMVEDHRERAEIMTLLRPGLAALDTSREGQLMLRYELAWRRLMERNINELRKRNEARWKDGQSFRRHCYLPPSPGWLLPEEEMGEDACERDHDDCGGLWDEDESAETCAVAELGEQKVDSVAEAAAVRNEPKDVNRSEETVWEHAQPPLRNEPKLESDIERSAEKGVEPSPRNEAGAEAEPSRLSLSLRAEEKGIGDSASFERIMAHAMRDVERDLPVPTIRLASAGELVRGRSAGGGSRRERRRKKAEARAGAK
jgi:hypothetical protein